MLLNVVKADYKKQYQIHLEFNNGETVSVNLKEVVFNDHRKIFEPLRDIGYFKKFSITLNTIAWENKLDLAPEFLLDLGKKQQKTQLDFA
ncbi:MAG TPA: DUF2442 domain-containing protein [Bacteroidales bacterium]|nr:DUF2442 domain-containing protein [Bacteroidales bacterium]